MIGRTTIASIIFPLCLLAAEEPDWVSDDTPPHPAYKAAWEAGQAYQNQKATLEAEYRKQLTSAIALVDRIEIFLLDFEMVDNVQSDERSSYFFISPYRKFSKIIDSKTIAGDSINSLSEVFSGLLATPDDPGPLCHFPSHGIRFFGGDSLVFETSLCWHCSNYFVKYPDDYQTATWVGFQNSPMEALLKNQLPIPAALAARFDEKHNSHKTKK